jgi:hypothetical protein
MASTQATDRLTNRKPYARQEDAIDRRIKPRSLGGVYEALLGITPGQLYRNRVNSRDRMYRCLWRRAYVEARKNGWRDPTAAPFRTTIAKVAAAAGYEVTGNPTEDKLRWQTPVRRCLNDLQAAGLIEWRGLRRANGQWQCIEVRVLNTPAQRTIMELM